MLDNEAQSDSKSFWDSSCFSQRLIVGQHDINHKLSLSSWMDLTAEKSFEGKLSKFRDMWYYCSAANLLGHIQLCIIHQSSLHSRRRLATTDRWIWHCKHDLLRSKNASVTTPMTAIFIRLYEINTTDYNLSPNQQCNCSFSATC